MIAKKLAVAWLGALLITIEMGGPILRAASSPPTLIPTVNVATTAAASEAGLVPLRLELPRTVFIVEYQEVELNEHIELPPETNRPPVLMVPPGTINVALYKKVTCSDKNPRLGAPELVTDSHKNYSDGGFLQMSRGLQWVQIDLEQSAAISYILVWHAYNAAQVYRCVVVQIADDADFTQNVRTVFNNDYENKTGLGIGNDKEYFETFEGRLISVKGEKARFIRSYSKGSTYSPFNRVTEIEVYGIPVR